MNKDLKQYYIKSSGEGNWKANIYLLLIPTMK